MFLSLVVYVPGELVGFVIVFVICPDVQRDVVLGSFYLPQCASHIAREKKIKGVVSRRNFHNSSGSPSENFPELEQNRNENKYQVKTRKN